MGSDYFARSFLKSPVLIFQLLACRNSWNSFWNSVLTIWTLFKGSVSSPLSD